MSSALDLTGMNMPLPQIFDVEELPFEISLNVIDCSDGNRQAKIKEVASFVSKIYTKFIQSTEGERDRLYEDKKCIIKKNIPTSSIQKNEQFRTALEKLIIQTLNKKHFTDCRVILSTDARPEKMLLDVAKGIFEDRDLHLLFPDKVWTRVYFKDRAKTKLCLETKFKGSVSGL